MRPGATIVARDVHDRADDCDRRQRAGRSRRSDRRCAAAARARTKTARPFCSVTIVSPYRANGASCGEKSGPLMRLEGQQHNIEVAERAQIVADVDAGRKSCRGRSRRAARDAAIASAVRAARDDRDRDARPAPARRRETRRWRPRPTTRDSASWKSDLRRRADSNCRMGLLQSPALPLGYVAGSDGLLWSG